MWCLETGSASFSSHVLVERSENVWNTAVWTPLRGFVCQQFRVVTLQGRPRRKGVTSTLLASIQTPSLNIQKRFSLVLNKS